MLPSVDLLCWAAQSCLCMTASRFFHGLEEVLCLLHSIFLVITSATSFKSRKIRRGKHKEELGKLYFKLLVYWFSAW
uniref:Uncharacterized protein n=1 Tax=Picea sitchensis TaxID=3332 RepID=D5AD29_PICSI|nr:unknown [Picea sitchensis]